MDGTHYVKRLVRLINVWVLLVGDQSVEGAMNFKTQTSNTKHEHETVSWHIIISH